MAEQTIEQLETWVGQRGYKVDVESKADGAWIVTLSQSPTTTQPGLKFAGTYPGKGVAPKTAYKLALSAAVAKADGYEGRRD